MPLLGSQRSMGPMLRALVDNSSIGSLMLCRGQAPNLGWHHSHPFYGLQLKRAALLCLTSFTHESGNTWIESGQHFCFIWMSYARARQTGTQDCATFSDPGRAVNYLPLLW